MLRVGLANLLAHKLRLLLSGLAIVLGVAFVAGTFVFTDTLDRSFQGIVGDTQPDVVVRPVSQLRDVGGPPGTGASSATVPGTLVEQLRAVPGVARVDADLTAPVSAFVLDTAGKVVGGSGAPGVVTNYTDAPGGPQREPVLTLESGRPPQRAGEVVLDVDTAERSGYALGARVPIVTTGTPARLEAQLVGTVRFGPDNNLLGASLLLFDPDSLRDTFFGGRDVATSISVTAREAADVPAVRAAVGERLPRGVEAVLGSAVADEQQRSIGQALGFITTFLLVFATIALVVGTYLIVNTFSILVAQRVRELALLRALGASRGQVQRAVLLEALVVGIVGSTLGLLAGFGLAVGLRALFGAIGLDLGGAELVLAPRTVVAAYAVGVLVTLVAAYVPARRAAQVPPVAAMRDDVALPEASLRRRLVVGVALLVLGVGAVAAGLLGLGPQALLTLGLGVLATLLGVTLVAPVVAPTLVGGLGVAYPRLFGAVGRIARENARRNPRRTSATAAALMIGLALVTALAVLGASTKASVAGLVQTGLRADFVVSNAVQQPFSADIATQLARVDGVESVSPQRFAFGLVDGSQDPIAAVDPATLSSAIDLPVVQGALSDLRPGSVLVSEDAARDRGWTVGGDVTVTLPAGEQRLRIAGVFGSSQFANAPVLLTFADLARGGVPVADTLVYVTDRPDADPAAVQRGLDAVVADQPLVSVQDRDEFVGSQSAQVDQLLNILYALLGLALVIAVIGIVNTLALSVVERTREIGLLRAVGMSRRQLRRMVRLESVVIAVLGAVLGIVMGLAYGVAIQRTVADEGVDVLDVPWGQLVVFVVVSGVVGVLAAVWPARRAARLDVLRAITTE